MRLHHAATAIAAALLMAGCSTPAANAPASPQTSAAPAPVQTSTPPVVRDAEAWADVVKQPSTTKVVVITEDNDPNDLIGRPNGYTSAAIIYDSGAECVELGASCGGTVEVWGSAADAKARSEYIQGVLKDAPMFGTEYHTLNGDALLRIAGQVKPSVAEAYATAFSAGS